MINHMEKWVHLIPHAVSNFDNQSIVIKVPYSGTLGTARFVEFDFDAAESQNNIEYVFPPMIVVCLPLFYLSYSFIAITR